MLYLKPSAKRVYNPISNTTKSNSPILEGKDVLASAQTGTGKQPVLHYQFCKYYHKVNNCDKTYSCLNIDSKRISRTILANIKEYSEFRPKSTVIFGGVNQNPQVTQLRQNRYFSGTPGRLIDLQNQGLISLAKVEI
jgi:ATP-dependent RNA helicase RhlE